jgi:exodeoxyribonuclease VII small subunit
MRKTGMPPAAGEGSTPPRFEESLGELEGLVRRLESGELPLEDALTAFERGIGLVRVLSERLAEVETRVETLLKSAGGAVVTQPVDDDEPA